MITKSFFIYILTNKHNTTFYIGVTNDLSRRIENHKSKVVKGFTEKYNLEKLVYYEIFEEAYSAISREKQLKNWHRNWKLKLITDKNPTFKDLSNDIQ